MNIIKLYNNKTFEYEKLKEIIFSHNFPWHTCSAHNSPLNSLEDSEYDFRYFSHKFLGRPGEGTLYPETCSTHTPLVDVVLTQIFSLNNIDVSCLYRASANLIPPISDSASFLKSKRTMEHVDHDFPHNNLLIYLTDAGGKTIVGNESYNPKEDDIIIFPGCMHCIETSHTRDRVVLVVTFGTKK